MFRRVAKKLSYIILSLIGIIKFNLLSFIFHLLEIKFTIKTSITETSFS